VIAIEQLLVAAFAPQDLLVKDQSNLHAGHAGAKEGKGHFDVTIVSENALGGIVWFMMRLARSWNLTSTHYASTHFHLRSASRFATKTFSN
jgi:hypothetical protein